MKPVLLMTRPLPSAHRFVDLLDETARGRVAIIFSPVLEIAPLEVDIRIPRGTHVIFTSVNGVDNAPDGQGRPACCVGPLTTRQAQKRGWHAEMVGRQAGELIETLARRRLAVPLLHLTGVHQRGDIVGELRGRGLTVDRLAIYDQRPVPLSADAFSALSGPLPVFLPVFSPRSASQLAPSLMTSRDVSVIAISEAAAEPLHSAPLAQVLVAAEPTGEAMRESLEKAILRHRLP